MKKRILAIILTVCLLASLMCVTASGTQTGTVTGSGVRMRTGPGTSYSIITTLDKGTVVTVLGEESGWYRISYGGYTGYMINTYIALSSSAGQTGTVTGSDVRMRTGPGTSYSIITTLDKGTTVTILGTSGSWYQISYGGYTGYMINTYISLNSSDGGNTSGNTGDSSSGTVTSGGGSSSDPLLSVNYITGTYRPPVDASILSAADETLGRIYSASLARLSQYTGYTADYSGYDYAAGYKVLSCVNGDEITLPLGSSIILLSGAGKLQTLDGEVINISTGETVSADTELELNTRYFAVENTTAMFKISETSVVLADGYYTKVLGEPVITVKLEQTVTGTQAYTKTDDDASFTLDTKTDGDGALSYTSSDTSVCSVDASGVVTINGTGSCTITVSAEETSKYLPAEFEISVTVTPAPQKEQTVSGTSSYTKTVGDSAFTLDAKTDGDGALSYASSDTSVCSVDASGVVTINGAGSCTITVSAGETSKYLPGSMNISITVKEKVSKTGTVTGSDVRMRTGPSTGYSIITTLSKGSSVTILGESYGWYYISYNGYTGYMIGDYISENYSGGSTTRSGTVTGSGVRMRSGPGTGYSVVTTFNRGTTVTVTGSSGSWYKVSYGGYSGYIISTYLSVY